MHREDFILVTDPPEPISTLPSPYNWRRVEVTVRYPPDQYPALRQALGWPHWWSCRVYGHPQPLIQDEEAERMVLGVRLPRRDRTHDRQWGALTRLVTAKLDAHHVEYEVLGVSGLDGSGYLPRA